VEDRVAPGTFDRNKIRIGVHPEHVDVWYWTIPFSNGRCSQGVVAEKSFLDQYPGDEMAKLKQLVSEEPGLAHLTLGGASHNFALAGYRAVRMLRTRDRKGALVRVFVE